MVRAGWFFCSECIGKPEIRSVAGGPIRGMYYGPSATVEETGD